MTTYMNSSEGSDDGWRSESVSDQREVSQVTLDGRIQDLLRTGVAKWRSILVQQVHQFLGDHSGK
jgi:hypothetical protein